MDPPIFPGRLRVAVPCGCTLGEGAIWDGRPGALLWVDVENETVWRWHPARDAPPECRRVGQRVGFVVPTPDADTFLLGLASGLARFSFADGEPTLVLRPEPDQPSNRLNDAGVGPDGSLYFGSMNDDGHSPTGSFYRWSAGGLASFGGQAAITNGPAIDAFRKLLYATDTTAGRIYRHRLRGDGEPGPREDFVAFGAGEGHPDGMAVDAEGHLWVCHFGGARITRFSPEGRPVLAVPVPTAQVTKLAFGGPDLATIYVTTAARGRDREIDPLAGHVFAFEVEGVRGLPAELCGVLGASA